MASSTHSRKKIVSSTPLNNDVLIEILLLLPVQSLVRLRAVCKFWRDLIDSPSFRKLHNHNNDGDDTVYLQFTFSNNQERKLSVKLLDNGKSLKSYKDKFNNEFSPFLELINGEYDMSYDHHYIRLVGPAKGLVCIYSAMKTEVPIAICNPFLGQLKILPNANHSCRISHREVAIGFAGEDYKVVQLVKCRKHRRLHAQLYSTKSNSWRELVLDDAPNILILKPIKSSSWGDAHWHGYRDVEEEPVDNIIILSLDMENEVFRIITISDSSLEDVAERGTNYEIFAEDKGSFLYFVLKPYDGNGVSVTKMYKSRCQGSRLSWIHMMNVEEPSHGIISTPPSLTSLRHCVVLMSNCIGMEDFLQRREFIVYDYRARKFIGRFDQPERSKVVECKGSFVSLLQS